MKFPPVLNAGPVDADPLTNDELSLLLAIPRAAQANPNATLFRLPRGPDPTLGWVDVTCAQVHSIVSRLALRWKTVLSNIMMRRTSGKTANIGPGTTICILVQPVMDALFHHLALWSLGCTIQYTMLFLGDALVSRYVQQSGCDIALCSEHDLPTRKLMEQLNIGVAILPESEHAFNLAEEEISSPHKYVPPWPKPQRPSPAIIIQTSASTGDPKLLKFSLYYYTLGLAWDCKQHLASSPRSASKSQPAKGPSTHPRLVLIPPYWQNFYRNFFVHLMTATPLALVPVSEFEEISGSEIVTWIKSLQAGALVTSAHRVREVLLLRSDIELLQSLYGITMSGSRADQQVWDLCEDHGLATTNILGTSELGRLLYTNRAPYNLLRPFPDVPPPLVVPLSDNKQAPTRSRLGDQPGREVQLWSCITTSPHLAHLAARGGVPLKLEPYPGEGPHHEQLAFNWGDIFREIRVPKLGVEGETELVYLHLGRADDTLRIASNDSDVNASEFEAELRTLLEPRLAELGGWHLDTLQLFGSNLPSTALVVQLQGEKHPDELLVRSLREGVEVANTKMSLTGSLKVDPHERMLVLIRNAQGSGVSYAGVGARNAPEWDDLYLSQTHKHTLRRWKNVQTFQPWLDQLNWKLNWS